MSDFRENGIVSDKKGIKKKYSMMPMEYDEYDSSGSGYSDSILSCDDLPATKPENGCIIQQTDEAKKTIFIVSDDAEIGGTEVDLDKFKIIYFKITVAQSTQAIRLAFIRKVYGLLTTQILLTACIGAMFMFTPGVKEYFRTRIWLMLVSLFGGITVLIFLSCCSKVTPINYILLIGFTICEGIAVGIVVAFYPKIVVLEAFVLTFLVFLCLTIFACQSKYDLNPIYSGLFASLIVLVGLGVLQIYFWSPASHLLFGFLGAIAFCIFIIVDTQFIMQKLSPEEYILATITLYLDALQLFLYILRIISIFTRK